METLIIPPHSSPRLLLLHLNAAVDILDIAVCEAILYLLLRVDVLEIHHVLRPQTEEIDLDVCFGLLGLGRYVRAVHRSTHALHLVGRAHHARGRDLGLVHRCDVHDILNDGALRLPQHTIQRVRQGPTLRILLRALQRLHPVLCLFVEISCLLGRVTFGLGV